MMAASRGETSPNAPHQADAVIRERYFGTPERNKNKKMISRPSILTRANPNDPVPAEEYTSYKLTEPVRLQMSENGAQAMKTNTVMSAFQMTMDRYHDNDAFAVKVGGKWVKTKLRDMYRMVRTMAKGFILLGLERFHGVGIMGYNAPEWIVSCLAAIFAGGVAVGIHYAHTAEQCKRAATEVQCNIIVVDSDDDLSKIIQIRSELPYLEAIVQYGGEHDETPEGVISWKKLLEMAEKTTEDLLKERILAQAPNYCCLVSYTAGRSGPSKPVMLSQDNVIWTAKVFGKYQSFSNTGGTHVSFQPLSQPIGQMLDIFIPLVYATTVYFVPRHLHKRKLVEVLREVHPTFYLTIPFVFEKIADHLELDFEKNAFSRLVTNTAMRIGRKAQRNAKERKSRPFGFWLANQLVFKKVHRRLGFDRCIEVHSAGSIMLQRTAEFFAGLNLVILDSYGSTELCGPHIVSLPDRNRIGSCGVEMDGCRTKFVPAKKTAYNEMRVKGRHVFMGYLNDPKLTAAAFDGDGWYQTGDTGYRDENGYVYFVGKVHELYQLSDGQMVAPIPVEMIVRNLLPCISHCFACGHRRPYLVMLFTFDAMVDDETDLPLDVVSKKAEMWLRGIGVKVSPISQMADSPPKKLVSVIQTTLDRVNSSANDLSTAIKKWKLLPRDFSIRTGELNTSFREKRASVLELYATTIDALYNE